MGIWKETSYHFDIIGAVYERVLDIVLPPHSLMNGLPLKNNHDGSDAQDWQNIKFLDTPCCDVCGFPFEFDQGTGALCGRCTAHRSLYARGRSAITYDEFSKKLVLDFKHGGRTDGLNFFAAQMLRAGRDLLTQSDLIIPVPLHKARLRQRRFNQAALLAHKISQLSDLPYESNVLMRKKNTPSQVTQTFVQRRRNVAGAFRIRAKNKTTLVGAQILLVDDVLTSGATLEACTKVLMRAGAKRVNILTLMRVVRATEIPT